MADHSPFPAAEATGSAATAAFSERITTALADENLQHSFRSAMDFLRDKRRQVFGDPVEWVGLQALGEQIKRDAVARLPELLDQLESRCRAQGIQVHRVADARAACEQIEALIAAQGGQWIVKGKSMATEEIGLNAHLEVRGYSCLESDMGEYIVQLAGETPSHIIMPAIHKTREDIARLFAERLPGVAYTEDVDTLIGIGREVLRRAFQEADVGISGVNFAVAETGTLCLVENEGNGRMSTTVPALHIAVMGIEKVIPRLADLPPLLSLLTRSATGQRITTYVNLIHGPRQSNEWDGPRAVHLILLDNGRSRMRAHPRLRETLRCIRCGACMNHCPVYARIGGHAYGAVIPGPIGQVVMPQIEGLQRQGELTTACTLNGACGEVCPVGIPLPDLIRELRVAGHEPPSTNVVPAPGDGLPGGRIPGEGRQRRWLEAWLWRGWAALHRHPRLYRAATRLMGHLGGRLPGWLPPWTPERTLPKPAPRSLHALMQARVQTSPRDLGVLPAGSAGTPQTWSPPEAAAEPTWQPPRYSKADRRERFLAQLTAAHAEVLRATESDWPLVLRQHFGADLPRTWWCSTKTASGRIWAEALGSSSNSEMVQIHGGDAPIEDWKATLFNAIDAALTESEAGIAETGSILLLPNEREPRLVSLVPPVHVVLVRESTLVDHFGELIDRLRPGKNGRIVTNPLLLSGPSKTADIQQTLAYGAHGPKRLIAVLLSELE